MAITYRGTEIPYGKHTNNSADRAVKNIEFPAVDWIEQMHFGKRGRQFNVRGRIADIATAFNKDTVEAWNDTSVGTLAIHGVSYTKVRFVRANYDECFKDAVTSKITCTFNLEFLQLKG